MTASVTVDDETTATTIEELRGAIGGPLRIPMGAGQATAAINGGETQTTSARGTTAVGIVTAANGVQIATVNENANVEDPAAVQRPLDGPAPTVDSPQRVVAHGRSLPRTKRSRTSTHQVSLLRLPKRSTMTMARRPC